VFRRLVHKNDNLPKDEHLFHEMPTRANPKNLNDAPNHIIGPPATISTASTEGSGIFTASSTEGTDLQLYHPHRSRLKSLKSLAALYIVLFSPKGKLLIRETIQSFVA
jgi:hypothetical protein